MKYVKLIKTIEEIAPLELAPLWDNSGVQIYTGQEEIERVLICLDITEEVIKEAENKKTGMIITHHPLIFDSIKKIDTDQVTGRYVCRLIKAGICVYSAHLTFDNAREGNNFYMAKLLGMENLKTAAKERPGEGSKDPAELPSGMTGQLCRQMTPEEAASHIINALEIPQDGIRMVKGKNTIKKIGLCTGAGGDFLDYTIREGCELFITGDVKLHEAQRAKAEGISLIDAGHYGTEHIFAENFARQLKEKAGKELEIIESTVDTDPFMV